jgi:hypothetical protein
VLQVDAGLAHRGERITQASADLAATGVTRFQHRAVVECSVELRVYGMIYTTVRITATARDILREMARIEGRPMQALLEEAVETLRRKRFLEEVNAGYASLRDDAKAWAAVEAERREWDHALHDGLTVHEPRGRYGAGPKRRPRKRRA